MLILKYIINFWIGFGLVAYAIGTIGDFIFYRTKHNPVKIWDTVTILVCIAVGPFAFFIVVRCIYNGIKLKAKRKKNGKQRKSL